MGKNVWKITTSYQTFLENGTKFIEGKQNQKVRRILIYVADMSASPTGWQIPLIYRLITSIDVDFDLYM